MDQEQWNAIRSRDKSYDGIFYYGRRTTRVVCRPSCPSRLCNPNNVIIFSTLEEAVAQGFRPCSRCRPELDHWEGPRTELVKTAKKLLSEQYHNTFSLSTIAEALFVNKSYLERTFHEQTGHTLLWYHNELRCREACRLLTRPELTISYIGNSVGFVSSSHFSKVFKEHTGCTPSRYRKEYFSQFVR